MKSKKYVYGVSFSVTEEMYQALKENADESQMGLGELLREIVSKHIKKNNNNRGNNHEK